GPLVDSARPMEAFFTAWLFVLGLCVGSFLNVVIARLPAGENIARPRSRCPKCGHTLSWYETVPLVSAQRVAALRAAGPGPGDVLPGGEAGDDDVEEAPHAEAEHEQPGGEEGLHRSRGVYERAWRSANTWVSPSST